MADMKIDLVGSLRMLLMMVGVYGTYKLLTIIFTLIFGSSANVALSGDINVTDTTETVLQNTETSFSDGISLLESGDTVVLGLIGLVVILKLFWPMISDYMGKKKSGSKGFK